MHTLRVQVSFSETAYLKFVSRTASLVVALLFAVTAANAPALAESCVPSFMGSNFKKAPARGAKCIKLPVKMVPVIQEGPGDECGETLFIQVPLESDKNPVEYVVIWSWAPVSVDSWVFKATGGPHSHGHGPYGAENLWSTTELAAYNTHQGIAPYKVKKGHGAWLVALGGGPGPCDVQTGHAEGWVWVRN